MEIEESKPIEHPLLIDSAEQCISRDLQSESKFNRKQKEGTSSKVKVPLLKEKDIQSLVRIREEVGS